jgi:hypothetical protein
MRGVRSSLTALVLAACSTSGADSAPTAGDASLDGGPADAVPRGDAPGQPTTDDGAMPDAGRDLPPILPSACGGNVRCVRAGDDLQKAIDGAVDGDIIQVAAATYPGNFTLTRKSLLVAGGFDASFASRDPSARETRLEANGSGSVVTIRAEAKTVRLDGFTISGGGGDPARAYSGAGVAVDLGTVTISNNRIVGNVVANANIGPTDTRGGGILATGNAASTISIVGNRIESNVSGRGAAIASSDVGTLVIAENVILQNRAYSDHGGGVFLNSPNATLRGNRIEGNEIGPAVNPYGFGGGVYVHQVGTVAHLSYNTYTRNKAPTTGSGFFVDNGAHATLDHELFYANACPVKSGAAILVDATDDANPIGSTLSVAYTTVAEHPCQTIFNGNGLMVVGPGSQATILRSIFWNNGPNQFASANGGAAPIVDDSFTSADPLFVDAAAGDFHLQVGSPAAGYGRF